MPAGLPDHRPGTHYRRRGAPAWTSARQPGETDACDVGILLRQTFAPASDLPRAWRRLLDELAAQEDGSAHPALLSDEAFHRQLEALLPQLRSFARSLSGSADSADDLVQETLARAWAARSRYQAGSNLRAWTSVILRNLFLGQLRRTKLAWLHARTLTGLAVRPPDQERGIDLADVYGALDQIPRLQREAILLIGVGDLTYERVAEMYDCSLGTIKSRVSRGRASLQKLLSEAARPARAGTAKATVDGLIAEVDALEQRGVDEVMDDTAD